MLLEASLALLLGILAGIFTGLMPGIHINLVSSFIIFSSFFLLTFTTPLSLAIFIGAMSISHIFFDFIPSIFLGAPDETGVSQLPGHKLLLKGRGYEAVLLAQSGALASLMISLVLIPLIFIILPLIYPFIERMMAWLLTLCCVFIIFNEKFSRKMAVLIFLLAGILGTLTLTLDVKQPLLPLLSGLFGSSTLLCSASKKITIPEQKIKCKIKIKKFFKPLMMSSAISSICAFLPGMGGSQAAIISSQVSRHTKKQFLILTGAVSMAVMVLSFLALYSIQKARTGSAAAIQNLIKLDMRSLLIIFLACFISAIISFILAKETSKIFARNIGKISYSKISIAVLIFLTIIVLLFSSFLGFLVYLTSTLIGLLAIESGIKKSCMMSCLLVPTILLYLPL
jgi:putative membrane protein